MPSKPSKSRRRRQAHADRGKPTSQGPGQKRAVGRAHPARAPILPADPPVLPAASPSFFPIYSWIGRTKQEKNKYRAKQSQKEQRNAQNAETDAKCARAFGAGFCAPAELMRRRAGSRRDFARGALPFPADPASKQTPAPRAAASEKGASRRNAGYFSPGPKPAGGIISEPGQAALEGRIGAPAAPGAAAFFPLPPKKQIKRNRKTPPGDERNAHEPRTRQSLA